MSEYLVSARKYRPLTFNSVVGQKALTSTLKNAIANNKLAHAYLFCGPRGVGKTTCARIFAKVINCFHPTPEGEACNECESCVSFNESRSYTIHELDAASNNSVDDIRSLIEQVRIPPQVGKYKVFIIDEVHMLSTQAFNAFLKTLEEPPKHAIFILATTEKHKILPTILSRCQIFDFSRITIKDTVEHLEYVAKEENVKAEPDALNIIAQKADGGMRDALSIFDQIASFTQSNITYKAVVENLNILDFEYYFSFSNALITNDVPEALVTLDKVLNIGFEGNNILGGLSNHFRDLLLCKDERTVSLFQWGESLAEKYKEEAKRIDSHLLYEALDVTNDADLNYRISKDKKLLLQITIIKLCQLSLSDDKGTKKNKELAPLFASKKNTEAKVTAGNTTTSPVRANVAQLKSNATPTPSTAPKSMNQFGVSLKSLTQKDEKSAKTEDVEKIDKSLNTPFSLENLQKAWIEYTDTIDFDKHYKNALVNSIPKEIENNTFEILSDNQMQADKLDSERVKVLNFLRNKLKNYSIDMTIRVDVNNEQRIAFTSVDKYKLMIEENESLKLLKERLNLELL